MARASARSASNSGNLDLAAARLATNPVFTFCSALCSSPSARASEAAFLNEVVASAMISARFERGSYGRHVRHGRQHLCDMAHFDLCALAAEPARDLHQAAV